MRGTGAVAFDGVTIYAFFSVIGRAIRVRLSADECERLDLCAGRPVRVRLPGREPAAALLTATRARPPFVWVEMWPTA